MKRDNDLKQGANLQKNGLKKKRVKAVQLQWLIQSPDFNTTEILWWELKRTVHKQMPTNLTEPNQVCKEEWAKIAPQWFER